MNFPDSWTSLSARFSFHSEKCVRYVPTAAGRPRCCDACAVALRKFTNLKKPPHFQDAKEEQMEEEEEEVGRLVVIPSKVGYWK